MTTLIGYNKNMEKQFYNSLFLTPFLISYISNTRLTSELVFKEPGGSLPLLHKPAIVPYLEQDRSSSQYRN